MSDSQTGAVARYDGQTGAYLGDVVAPDSPMTIATGLAFVGQPLSITVPNTGNFAPVANAGTYLPGFEGQSVALAGTFTDFNDNNPATHTYQWQVTDAGGNVVASSTQQAFAFTPLHGGTYTASFTVTDSGELSDTASTTLTAWVSPPTLIISGIGTPVAGTPYTVNLSAANLGANTIESWTINWGDGTTQVIAGNPSAASHTYAQDQLFYNIFATATDADGTFQAYSPQPDLLVHLLNQVETAAAGSLTRIDGLTGLSRGQFTPNGQITSGGGGLAVYGPDGNLYVPGLNGVLHLMGKQEPSSAPSGRRLVSILHRPQLPLARTGISMSSPSWVLLAVPRWTATMAARVPFWGQCSATRE